MTAVATKMGLRSILLRVFLIVLFSGIVYHSCFRVTNEVGPIGADKIGRQIFLQTIDHLLAEPLGLSVVSEWEDTTFLARFFIQEPMRTTIRFVAPAVRPLKNFAPRAFLDTPYRDFFAQFRPPSEASIHLRTDISITLEEFFSRLEKLEAKSVEDMLAAFGFQRFEVFMGSEPVERIQLRAIGRGNMKVWGGED